MQHSNSATLSKVAADQQLGFGAQLGSWRLHTVDAVVIHELLEVLQVVPPLEEEGLRDEAEPGCDQELLALGLLQHLLQLLLAHVAVALDLVGVWAQLHVLQWDEMRTVSLHRAETCNQLHTNEVRVSLVTTL